MLMYQRWVGTLRIGAKNLEVSERPVDQWIPEPPPEGAKVIGQDTWEYETIFPGLLKAKGQIGPFRPSITLNATFTGQIEYWQKQQ
jgi:hypothetical protein